MVFLKDLLRAFFKKRARSIPTINIADLRTKQQGITYLKFANTDVKPLGWFDYLTNIGFVKSTNYPKGRLEFGAMKTLEGRSKFQPSGYSCCRGVIGEKWPKKTALITAQMEPIDDPDRNGWTTYKPKGINTCFAFKMLYDFRVVALNGTVLTGKAGDYLVDNGSDQWIVRGDIFELSYKKYFGMT